MKTILVTGASTGIGRVTAIELARKGHTVIACVRSEEAEASVLAEARALGLKSLRTERLDVESSRSIERLTRSLEDELGETGLDGLVNNAGIAVAGPVELLAMDEIRKQFEVNVFGAVELTQKCLPLLRLARGRIVNVSSISGRIAFPGLGAYSASKFALEAFSDALRRELSEQGIKVSVVEPGPIKTPIWSKAESRAEKALGALGFELRELYAPIVQELEKSSAEAREKGLEAIAVARVIETALTAARPKTRYPVGGEIRMTAGLLNFVPDAVVDFAFEMAMKKTRAKLSGESSGNGEGGSAEL